MAIRMGKTMNEYVEQHDGGYWITGTRVSLDSVVYAFQRGTLPESIVRSFPLLTLEQVYGAITYYLAHKQEINEYLQQGELAFGALRGTSREELRRTKPELYERLQAAQKVRETYRLNKAGEVTGRCSPLPERVYNPAKEEYPVDMVDH